jgi:hypothetical protein
MQRLLPSVCQVVLVTLMYPTFTKAGAALLRRRYPAMVAIVYAEFGVAEASVTTLTGT